MEKRIANIPIERERDFGELRDGTIFYSPEMKDIYMKITSVRSVYSSLTCNAVNIDTGSTAYFRPYDKVIKFKTELNLY